MKDGEYVGEVERRRCCEDALRLHVWIGQSGDVQTTSVPDVDEVLCVRVKRCLVREEHLDAKYFDR